MKTLLIIVLLIPFTTFADSDEAIMRDQSSKSRWILAQPLYGQLRLVPDKAIKLSPEAASWYGSAGSFKNFSLRDSVGSSSKGVAPISNPAIYITGHRGSLNSGTARVARLFDTQHPGTKYAIVYRQPPSQIKINQEYLAATVVGEGSRTNWKVYIRFTLEEKK